MRTSTTGQRLIAEFEGCKLTAYKCPAGIWTIGVGHTSAAGKPVVKSGMRITQAEADDILARDLVRFENAVARVVEVPLNQNQFDALVSFAFNLGEGALASSTLLKKLNAGDYTGAADQFARWNKVGPKVLAGLTRRRAAEADLFRRPVTGASTVPATPAAPTIPRAPTGLLAALLGLFRRS
ncbi:lysozyme [Methylorubrum thiocyanatum]|uniref:lysozyme n=1 Tax=Methylorubrum thiocyanatum TaxID=47958 RepID=UPI003F81ED66